MNLKKLGGCKPKPPIYRFNMSYIKDETTGCWVWQGKSRSGSSQLYGRIKVNKKAVPAHRFSWEIHNNQKVPNGMFVLHRCDNPECVNPDHLFVGTHQNNMDDKVAKNRQAKGDCFKNRNHAKGERNGLSKLTEQQVIKIFQDQRSQRVIAKDHNITQAAVWAIKNKRTWSYLHD
jgi:hypothetical protein